MALDKVTEKMIATLHPSVRNEVTVIANECNSNLQGNAQMRICQALRTFAEQDDLYAQGRTKPGKIVTKVKGGHSIHNYGFAVDIVMILNGKEASWETGKDWDNDTVADWYECVKVFARHGWDWGGNWKTFKDMPHFDKKGMNDWRKLINKPRDNKGYVIL